MSPFPSQLIRIILLLSIFANPLALKEQKFHSHVDVCSKVPGDNVILETSLKRKRKLLLLRKILVSCLFTLLLMKAQISPQALF